MKVFFIVGEDSGDTLAAGLIEHLSNYEGEAIECMGVGGPKMKEVGFNVLLPTEEITTFGILEALPKIPILLKAKEGIIAEIENMQPDFVVTVDFPEFNFFVARLLKKRGIFKGKLVHYVAPTVWAWREWRAKKIASYYDAIMCLFPMEVEYFSKHGMKAICVGHPIVEEFVETSKENSYRQINNISDDTKILGLFFGSRESEFKNLKKVLVEAAKYVIENEKKIHVIVPTLPKSEFIVQSFLEELNVSSFVSANQAFKWPAFQACDVAIAVSGTVGLELAYARIPHVITYKLSSLTYNILKLLVKVRRAHLVNILLNKDIVPEFIQSECEPEIIAASVLGLLNNNEKRKEMLKGFEEFREFLGANNAIKPSERASEFLISMHNGKV